MIHSVTNTLKQAIAQLNFWKKEFYKVKIIKTVYHKHKHEYTFIVELKADTTAQKERLEQIQNTVYANSKL